MTQDLALKIHMEFAPIMSNNLKCLPFEAFLTTSRGRQQNLKNENLIQNHNTETLMTSGIRKINDERNKANE